MDYIQITYLILFYILSSTNKVFRYYSFCDSFIFWQHCSNTYLTMSLNLKASYLCLTTFVYTSQLIIDIIYEYKTLNLNFVSWHRRIFQYSQKVGDRYRKNSGIRGQCRFYISKTKEENQRSQNQVTLLYSQDKKCQGLIYIYDIIIYWLIDPYICKDERWEQGSKCDWCHSLNFYFPQHIHSVHFICKHTLHMKKRPPLHCFRIDQRMDSY